MSNFPNVYKRCCIITSDRHTCRQIITVKSEKEKRLTRAARRTSNVKEENAERKLREQGNVANDNARRDLGFVGRGMHGAEFRQ